MSNKRNSEEIGSIAKTEDSSKTTSSGLVDGAKTRLLFQGWSDRYKNNKNRFNPFLPNSRMPTQAVTCHVESETKSSAHFVPPSPENENDAMGGETDDLPEMFKVMKALRISAINTYAEKAISKKPHGQDIGCSKITKFNRNDQQSSAAFSKKFVKLENERNEFQLPQEQIYLNEKDIGLTNGHPLRHIPHSMNLAKMDFPNTTAKPASESDRSTPLNNLLGEMTLLSITKDIATLQETLQNIIPAVRKLTKGDGSANASSSKQATGPKRFPSIDVQLENAGLIRVKIPLDRNSFYGSLSYVTRGTRNGHVDIRREVTTYIENNRDRFQQIIEGEGLDWDRYITDQKTVGRGGATELMAYTELHNARITIYSDIMPPQLFGQLNDSNDRAIINVNNKHYDAAIPVPKKRSKWTSKTSLKMQRPSNFKFNGKRISFFSKPKNTSTFQKGASTNKKGLNESNDSSKTDDLPSRSTIFQLREEAPPRKKQKTDNDADSEESSAPQTPIPTTPSNAHKNRADQFSTPKISQRNGNNSSQFTSGNADHYPLPATPVTATAIKFSTIHISSKANDNCNTEYNQDILPIPLPLKNGNPSENLFNAVVQCAFSIKEFVNCLNTWKPSNEPHEAVALATQQLLQIFQKGDKQITASTANICEKLKINTSKKKIIYDNKLKKFLTAVAKSMTLDADNYLIKNHFGQLKTTFACNKCNIEHEETTEWYGSKLTVDVDTSLEQLLINQFSQLFSEDECSICKRYSSTTTTLKIQTLPKILGFTIDNEASSLTFPDYISMNCIMTSSQIKNLTVEDFHVCPTDKFGWSLASDRTTKIQEALKNDKNIYELIAIINMIEKNLQTTVFNSFVKRDNTWFFCNNKIVKKSTSINVKTSKETACILLYRKLDNDENSEADNRSTPKLPQSCTNRSTTRSQTSQSNIEKVKPSASKRSSNAIPIPSLNQQLQNAGLVQVQMDLDHNCFYTSLSTVMYGHADSHAELRDQITSYIENNRDRFQQLVEEGDALNWDRYLADQKTVGRGWGGEVELAALTEMTDVRVTIYQEGMSPQLYGADNTGKPYAIVYLNRNHYNAAIPAAQPPSKAKKNVPRPSVKPVQKKPKTTQKKFSTSKYGKKIRPSKPTHKLTNKKGKPKGKSQHSDKNKSNNTDEEDDGDTDSDMDDMDEDYDNGEQLGIPPATKSEDIFSNETARAAGVLETDSDALKLVKLLIHLNNSLNAIAGVAYVLIDLQEQIKYGGYTLDPKTRKQQHDNDHHHRKQYKMIPVLQNVPIGAAANFEPMLIYYIRKLHPCEIENRSMPSGASTYFTFALFDEKHPSHDTLINATRMLVDQALTNSTTIEIPKLKSNVPIAFEKDQSMESLINRIHLVNEYTKLGFVYLLTLNGKILRAGRTMAPWRRLQEHRLAKGNENIQMHVLMRDLSFAGTIDGEMIFIHFLKNEANIQLGNDDVEDDDGLKYANIRDGEPSSTYFTSILEKGRHCPEYSFLMAAAQAIVDKCQAPENLITSIRGNPKYPCTNNKCTIRTPAYHTSGITLGPCCTACHRTEHFNGEICKNPKCGKTWNGGNMYNSNNPEIIGLICTACYNKEHYTGEICKNPKCGKTWNGGSMCYSNNPEIVGLVCPTCHERELKPKRPECATPGCIKQSGPRKSKFHTGYIFNTCHNLQHKDDHKCCRCGHGTTGSWYKVNDSDVKNIDGVLHIYHPTKKWCKITKYENTNYLCYTCKSRKSNKLF